MVLHVTYVANIYGYPFVVNIPAQSGSTVRSIFLQLYFWIVTGNRSVIDQTTGDAQKV